MYKQQNNVDIVNDSDVITRAHDALLYTTVKHNEKYMKCFFNKGAIAWNCFPLEYLERKNCKSLFKILFYIDNYSSLY